MFSGEAILFIKLERTHPSVGSSCGSQNDWPRDVRWCQTNWKASGCSASQAIPSWLNHGCSNAWTSGAWRAAACLFKFAKVFQPASSSVESRPISRVREGGTCQFYPNDRVVTRPDSDWNDNLPPPSSEYSHFELLLFFKNQLSCHLLNK